MVEFIIEGAACFLGGAAVGHFSAWGILAKYLVKIEAAVKSGVLSTPKADIEAVAKKLESFADKSEVAIRREADLIAKELRFKL